jgi:hypothetical protein
MASKTLKVDDITKNVNATDFYATRKKDAKISFSRLEKGLVLFACVHEKAKATLASEMALWDHRLCYYMIKDGKCNNPADQCHYEHEIRYRQPDLCISVLPSKLNRSRN